MISRCSKVSGPPVTRLPFAKALVAPLDLARIGHQLHTFAVRGTLLQAVRGTLLQEERHCVSDSSSNRGASDDREAGIQEQTMHCKSPGDLRRQSSVPDMACQESVRRNVSALGPSDRFDPRIAPIRVRPSLGLAARLFAVDTRGLHQLPALTRIMLQGGTLQAVRSRLQLFSPGTKRRAFKSLAERPTARYPKRPQLADSAKEQPLQLFASRAIWRHSPRP